MVVSKSHGKMTEFKMVIHKVHKTKQSGNPAVSGTLFGKGNYISVGGGTQARLIKSLELWQD